MKASTKALIYCRRSGERGYPITARIEWLADGVILPIMYWMPDGSCFEVTHTRECIPLAYLKEGGQGLRFTVRARLVRAENAYLGDAQQDYETYLYFADRKFSAKNIIDAQYCHVGKEFVPVVMDVFPDCEWMLINFKARGAQYMVEKTTCVEPRGCFNGGGIGLCHIVDARRVSDPEEILEERGGICRRAALYFEFNKWFVTVKVSG